MGTDIICKRMNMFAKYDHKTTWSLAENRFRIDTHNNNMYAAPTISFTRSAKYDDVDHHSRVHNIIEMRVIIIIIIRD